MFRETVKKEGMMKRAVIAWAVLNISMLVIFAALIWLVGKYMDQWYVAMPMMIAIIIGETWISGSTIAPIVREWIRQETTLGDEVYELIKSCNSALPASETVLRSKLQDLITKVDGPPRGSNSVVVRQEIG